MNCPSGGAGGSSSRTSPVSTNRSASEDGAVIAIVEPRADQREAVVGLKAAPRLLHARPVTGDTAHPEGASHDRLAEVLDPEGIGGGDAGQDQKQ